MALETPVWLEAVSGDPAITFSARQLRTIADATWAVEGVVGDADLLVVPRAAGANMSVDVSVGMAVIQGDSVVGQGKYVMRSTSVVNVPITAAPVTGTRTDLIIAQLFDKQADGGSAYGWSIQVLTGVMSTVPTLPASAIELGRVLVAVGAASITAGAISNSNRMYAGAYRLQRPDVTVQSAQPPFNAVGTATDFVSGSWAPLSFVVPPSGKAWVTISARMSNTAAANATISAGWRVSTGTLTTIQGYYRVEGTIVTASQRALVTGVPGSQITLTPTWLISAGNSSSCSIGFGLLSVEYIS